MKAVKQFGLKAALVLTGLTVAGVSQAASDWKSMPGTSCSTEYGGAYCPIVREFKNTTANPAVAFSGFVVEVEGSGTIGCTVFSSPGNTPFYWWQTGVSKSRVDSGAISFSAADLNSIPYFNDGIYLLQCVNQNYVRSYRWNESGTTN